MHTEHLVVDHGGEAQVVEDLGAVAPHIHGAVLPQTLVVEPVHLGDLAGLVVAAYKSDSIRVSHFQCQQQQEGLHTVVTPVHKIAQE